MVLGLVKEVLQEKRIEKKRRENDLEFLNKIVEFTDDYMYEIVGYFGEKFVKFNKKHFKIMIDKDMVEKYLDIKQIHNGLQFYYYAYGIDGSYKDLEIIKKNMDDNEIREKIELSLKYLLQQTVSVY